MIAPLLGALALDDGVVVQLGAAAARKIDAVARQRPCRPQPVLQRRILDQYLIGGRYRLDVVALVGAGEIAVVDGDLGLAGEVDGVRLAGARAIADELGVFDVDYAVRDRAEDAVLVVVEIALAHGQRAALVADAGPVAVIDPRAGELEGFDCQVARTDDERLVVAVHAGRDGLHQTGEPADPDDRQVLVRGDEFVGVSARSDADRVAIAGVSHRRGDRSVVAACSHRHDRPPVGRAAQGRTGCRQGGMDEGNAAKQRDPGNGNAPARPPPPARTAERVAAPMRG